MASELHVITAYFNPRRFAVRRENYRTFRADLGRRGINCFTMECLMGGASAELVPSADTFVVRARDVLWQKERLLNLAVERLPRSVTKVAWVDGDVLFQNPRWAEEAVELLEEYPAVQLFERAVWLPRGGINGASSATSDVSFAWTWNRRHSFNAAGIHVQPGTPGFAWAARRALLERHRLYDGFIIGGSDDLIARAMVGDWELYGPRHVDHPPALRRHYEEWARP